MELLKKSLIAVISMTLVAGSLSAMQHQGETQSVFTQFLQEETVARKQIEMSFLASLLAGRSRAIEAENAMAKWKKLTAVKKAARLAKAARREVLRLTQAIVAMVDQEQVDFDALLALEPAGRLDAARLEAVRLAGAEERARKIRRVGQATAVAGSLFCGYQTVGIALTAPVTGPLVTAGLLTLGLAELARRAGKSTRDQSDNS